MRFTHSLRHAALSTGRDHSLCYRLRRTRNNEYDESYFSYTSAQRAFPLSQGTGLGLLRSALHVIHEVTGQGTRELSGDLVTAQAGLLSLTAHFRRRWAMSRHKPCLVLLTIATVQEHHPAPLRRTDGILRHSRAGAGFCEGRRGAFTRAQIQIEIMSRP